MASVKITGLTAIQANAIAILFGNVYEIEKILQKKFPNQNLGELDTPEIVFDEDNNNPDHEVNF